jgi:hypothetical protein
MDANTVACANCKNGLDEPKSKQVICRRFPPSVHMIMVPNPQAKFDPKAPPFLPNAQAIPPTIAQDWMCGEFARKEAAIKVAS